QVAAGLLIAVASSAATLLIVQRSSTAANLSGSDVVASHIRSLMANHLTDVASTDEHNVKPWFDGKVPFAPDVPRLDSAGFRLIGGRVDSVGHEPAAALVYGRRQHVINVFVWPSRRAADSGSAVSGGVERGYNVVRWIRNDLQYAAASDLAIGELRAFVEEFRRESRAPITEPR
ncbi:MAG: anti-sigma factor, partial [Gemmatimonadota bacterium]